MVVQAGYESLPVIFIELPQVTFYLCVSLFEFKHNFTFIIPTTIHHIATIGIGNLLFAAWSSAWATFFCDISRDFVFRVIHRHSIPLFQRLDDGTYRTFVRSIPFWFCISA